MEAEQKDGHCLNCNKIIDLSQRLFINQRSLPLTPCTEIFIDNDNTPDAVVRLDANGLMLLQNISSDSWTVETPSGKIKTVVSQDVMPVREGLKITFKVRDISYRGIITTLS